MVDLALARIGRFVARDGVPSGSFDRLRSVGRWLFVGGLFTALTVPGLYLFRDLLGLSLMAASVVTWEIGQIMRFLVTDRWVFGHRRPTRRRFFQYHVAAASSFVVWWSVTNLLPRWGVNYLLGSVLATGCSVSWSLATSYVWVWRATREGAS